MEHPRPQLQSTRPRKAARLAAPEQEPSATRTRAELAALVEALAAGKTCLPAWSCSNLIALPTPAPPPASSLLGTAEPATAPTITLSHFTGSPTSPKPRLSFNLALPSTGSIAHLAFSPCGAYLLAVTAAIHEDVVTVFEQQDGCINRWIICWSERVARFGEDALPGSDVKRFVGLRWIGEPRNWYPAPDATTADAAGPSRPLYCAPARSPPIVGAAFIVILSSSELLFVHLPRTTPLLPLTVVLPLHPPPPHLELTLSALPTAPTFSALSNGAGVGPGASPENAIDALVANLVDGMPSDGPCPSVVAGALGLGNTNGATGGEALKEELRAAEAGANASKLGRKRRITKGAAGLVRAQNAPESSETLFLIATTSKSITTPPAPSKPIPRPPALRAVAEEAPVATMLDLTSASSPDDFSNDFTDFSALDEAFGGPSVPPPVPIVEPPTEGVVQQGERASGGDDDHEKKVDLCEVRVQMNALEGPRLTIRPLPPLYLTNPTDSGNSNSLGELTHLDWLEDVELPVPSADHTSQSGVDLRLLAVSASPTEEGAFPSSSMTTWAFSNEPVALSEAFAGLECKKGDATRGVGREWMAIRAASRTFDGLVSFLDVKAGPLFGSFCVGETRLGRGKGVVATRVVGLSSSTLETLEELGETTLPGSTLYTGVAFSVNRGLFTSSPFSSGLFGEQPVLAAAPLASSSDDLPSTLATRLTLALARQLDASDLIGRVIGLRDDAQTLGIARQVRDNLQGMLAPPRRFEKSALLLELLGLITVLYSAAPTLALRGSIAADVIHLASLVRAFRKCEKKDRVAAAAELGYRCESDAVWPLIGHAIWYCEFARELAKDCAGMGASFGGDASPRQVLVLHPFPRSLLLQGAECILGLQGFLAAFPLHQNLVVDTAKTVLDDAVDFGGLGLAEWKSVLGRAGELDGAGGAGPADSPELRDSLITLTLPSTLNTSASLLSTIITSSSLTLLPSTFTLRTPPPEALSTSANTANFPLDVIRRNRLPLGTDGAEGSFKLCLRCGERTETRVLVGNETGKWTAWEAGWEGRCACGGGWVGVAS